MVITPHGIKKDDGTYIEPKRRHELIEVNIDDIIRTTKKELKYGLFVPGRLDGISILVEYMYKWFLSKFGGEKCNFFKAINLDGSDPLNMLKFWKTKDWIKRPRPKLTIIPKPDIKYNMDNQDDDFNSIIGYINRTKDDNACFFRDEDNNVFLDVKFRLTKVDMNYKIMVGQKGAQYDIYDRMYMACRVGKTLTMYANVDYLVPTSLIRHIAADLHFQVDDRGMPVDSVKFLEYMNSHSAFPFLYKLRGVTREWEFYVRLSDMMIHIRDIEADLDEGNKQGMLTTDYILEMNCVATMPSPRFFVYYTCGELEQVVTHDRNNNEFIADLVSPIIPSKNQSQWPIFLDGTFELDNVGEFLKLSIYDLFQESNKGTKNDMLDAIEYCRLRRISPEVFLEIKCISDGKEQSIYIDWNKMTIKSRYPIMTKICTIIVYVDLVFLHQTQIETQEMYKSRFDAKEPTN